MRHRPLRVSLEIELSADPVTGMVVTADRERHEFTGWSGLLDSLDGVAASALPAPSTERARRELLLMAAEAAFAGGEVLSPSERRVADLVASGLTNREVAEELVVTLSTVEVHLTNTYRKLGITSRGELPFALGLGEPAISGPDLK